MSTITAEIDGTYIGTSESEIDKGMTRVTVTARGFADRAEAEAFAAAFPKYAQFRVSDVSSIHGDYVIVSARALFMPVKGNDRNEAGERRIRAIAKGLAAAGTEQTGSRSNWKYPMTADELNAYGFAI